MDEILVPADSGRSDADTQASMASVVIAVVAEAALSGERIEEASFDTQPFLGRVAHLA